MKCTFELDDDLKRRFDELPHGARKLMLNELVARALLLAEEDVWKFMSAIDKGYLRVTIGEPR